MKTATSLTCVIVFALVGWTVWLLNDWPAWMVLVGFYGALMVALFAVSKSRRIK